jgi:hypothetical protein
VVRHHTEPVPAQAGITAGEGISDKIGETVGMSDALALSNIE